mmetsp:Transcript_35692/g.93292  ORF Transcript_35692/g.93292 Transcript_35692/m.93292 type:complete len:168 (+) Transcript_35692:164-667(+)
MATPGDAELLTGLKGTLEEMRKRCRMTSKIHYNTVELYQYTHTVLGLASVCGVAALQAGAARFSVRAKVTVAASTAAAALGFIKPATSGQAHHHAGVKYGSLERRARLLELELEQAVKYASRNPDELKRHVEELWVVKAELDADSPLASELVKRYTKRQLNGKPLDK